MGTGVERDSAIAARAESTAAFYAGLGVLSAQGVVYVAAVAAGHAFVAVLTVGFPAVGVAAFLGGVGLWRTRHRSAARGLLCGAAISLVLASLWLAARAL